MKIVLDAQTAIQLRAWTIATRMEFSGLADVVRYNGDLVVGNAHVLDVGTFGFTDFTPEMIMTLPPSDQRRCWFHRHPIECWSGTDLFTMTHIPCGSIPEMIAWSVAIVWTPKGWLGRLDMFVPEKKHFDLEVVEEELYPIQSTIYDLAVKYARKNNLPDLAVDLRADFDKRHKNMWFADENMSEIKVIKKAGQSTGPAIHFNYEKPRPAPKKKSFLQKAFPWLLDKPKGEQ